MTLRDKLVLGCAQFSARYGYNASAHGLTAQEKKRILVKADAYGVSTLDTANAYGSSEKVLGSLGIEKFEVNTKLPVYLDESITPKEFVRCWLEETKLKLKSKRLNYVFFHRSQQLFTEFGADVFYELNELKVLQKQIKGIGVSVYDPEELKNLVDIYNFDIVQIPFNIFDTRFDKGLLLKNLQSSSTLIQARSVFLQGILLQSPKERPKYFLEWQDIFDEYDRELKRLVTTDLSIV